jgi:hypothetical protein
MKNYEVGENSTRMRHPTLFKDKQNHFHLFAPTDKLVQTLPLDFLTKLNDSSFFLLPDRWLDKIKNTLTQVGTTSIKLVQLMRIMSKSDRLPFTLPKFFDLHLTDSYIYEDYLDRSHNYVRNGQITEIIGEEPWMDSEITCHCNMESDCKIMLTLGSKRKSFDSHKFTIGDWVTVTGHGNLFPCAQVKELDFSTNTAK